MTVDGWPVRRIKCIELIAARAGLSAGAKLIAIVWMASVRQGRALEMSVQQVARRVGRFSRSHSSQAIAELEQVFGPIGWLRIERRSTHGAGSLRLLIRWPILGRPEEIARLHEELTDPHEPEPAHGAARPVPESAPPRMPEWEHPPCPNGHTGYAQTGTNLVPDREHRLTGTGTEGYRTPPIQMEMCDAKDSSVAGALRRRFARRNAG
jgi:hypothetical protein